MRKISKEAAKAFESFQEFRQGNTVVKIYDGKVGMFLHGNLIAENAIGNGAYSMQHLTVASGYIKLTKTTKTRLNALKGVRIYTKDGVDFLNDITWDGEAVNPQSHFMLATMKCGLIN